MAFLNRSNGSRSLLNPRFIIAGIIACVSVVGYCSRSSINELTGRKQHISLTPEDEIVMGADAAPVMAQQFGGLSNDSQAAGLVKQVGDEIVKKLPTEAIDYQYEFHLLADSQTVNAFALPGGQIFITTGLLKRLETPGQLAGVLGHEIGHVVARHSAEHLAKASLTQGLVGAATVAGSGGNDGGQTAQMVAATVGNMINLKYGRKDELESDQLGLRFMHAAGYDPRVMIDVMQILEKAGGGARQSEFMSSHPNPGNRIERIKEHLQTMFPGGLSDGLKK